MAKAQTLANRADSFGAIQMLEAGKGFGLLSTDHVGTETCAQTIVRKGLTVTARATDHNLLEAARTAVVRLRAGKGWDLASSDHSSDTCVQTIVRLTMP